MRVSVEGRCSCCNIPVFCIEFREHSVHYCPECGGELNINYDQRYWVFSEAELQKYQNWQRNKRKRKDMVSI